MCVHVLFLAPTKKGKKRKAQREEEHSDKTRRMLTSKEVRVFVLGIEQRGEGDFFNSVFLKLSRVEIKEPQSWEF